MKSPQRALNEYLARTTPKAGVIKKYAHAVTLAVCGLIIPSIWAIFLRRQGINESEQEWVWAAETLWKVHFGLSILASVLWVFERPKKTNYLPVKSFNAKEDDAT